MNREAAIEQFVQNLLADCVRKEQKRNPERFNRLCQENPDYAESYLAKQRIYGADVADCILGKGKPLMKKVRCGGFHNHNKNSKLLFAALTGIVLPKNNKETDEVIYNYIGIDAVEQDSRERQEAIDNAAAEKRAAEDIAYAKRIGDIREKIISNTFISGTDLVELAKSLDIEVHPRTIGLCRQRVVEIKDGQARVTRGGSCQSARVLYADVKKRVVDKCSA